MNNSTDLQFEYKSGCLIVRTSSRYVIVQKEVAMKAVVAAIKARPVRAALVDLHGVPSPYTFMDRYQLGELAGRYLTQVPLAVPAPKVQTDKQLIGKLVANNRGANLEVFTDPAKAQAWLQNYLTPDK